MKAARLKELLDKLSQVRIAVLGDLFLDRWLSVDPALNEPSLETGLAAWQVVWERCQAGAAGTVLNNLSALGVGKLHAIGLLGLDGAGWEVESALNREGVDTVWTVKSRDIATPQYIKPMFLQAAGDPVEGNRLDVKNLEPTPEGLQEQLMANLRSAAEQVDAVIVLDQLDREDTGVVTARMRAALERLGEERQSLIVFEDSRSFIHRFRGVTIKCNDREALRITTGQEPNGPFDQDAVFAAMRRLRKSTGRPVYVTCNANGVAVDGPAGQALVPAVRQPGPIDVCGAGDACTAGIVSALCAGADPVEAAFLGNLAAGVTVRKLGDTGTASQEELWALYREQFGEDER